VTPSDPQFVHARADGLFEGQVGIQIQASKPLSMSDVWRAQDTRVRLDRVPTRGDTNRFARKGGAYAILALRVGSDGRDPVWARWPIKLRRAVPDAAQWKWVRVSVRLHGPHERWTCEITVDDPAALPRTLDTSLTGAIAVEWSWDPLEDGSIRVATWVDTRGGRGEITIPARTVAGFVKGDTIRSVRDMLSEEARPKIAEAIVRSKDRLPLWLARAGQWILLTKSPIRLHDLLRRWQAERCDGARDAYDLLRAWSDRDDHLWEYETGVRRGAIGVRTDLYRVLARRWSEQYRCVLLSDQDLSREARWGNEGTSRFRAAPDDLRSALKNAFGDEDSVLARWRDAPSENDERDWCERTRDAWTAGGARGDGRFAERKEKTNNAWAARKARKAAKLAAEEGARNAAANGAE